jgi:Na+/phosphate symporter
MRKSGMQMSEAAKRDILDLHGRVEDYVKFVNRSVREEVPEAESLSKALNWGNNITHFMKECRSGHLERVEAGLTSPLQSLIITDMLNYYRRVKDHALNIVEVLAGEK